MDAPSLVVSDQADVLAVERAADVALDVAQRPVLALRHERHGLAGRLRAAERVRNRVWPRPQADRREGWFGLQRGGPDQVERRVGRSAVFNYIEILE